MTKYTRVINDHVKQVNDLAADDGATSFTAASLGLTEYTYNGVTESGTVVITHASDALGKRVVQIQELVPGPEYTDTSLDFDLADESQFIQEDGVSGTQFTAGVVELATTPNTSYITTSDQNQIDLSNIETINYLTITKTEPANTTVKALASFDGRTTWKKYDGAWSTVSGLDFTSATVSGLETGFSGYNASGDTTLDIALELSSTVSGTTPSIDQISINYNETGLYYIKSSASYSIINTGDTTTSVTKLTAGTRNIKASVLL